jgi:hypothetical protein
LYEDDEDFVKEYLYYRLMGYWGKYFIKEHSYTLRAEDSINDNNTAIELFLKDAEYDSILRKYKDIIIEYLTGNEYEDDAAEKDIWPEELKRHLLTKKDLTDAIVFEYDEIPKLHVNSNRKEDKNDRKSGSTN